MNNLENFRIRVYERVKRLREERRHTQAEFAKLLGLSQQQYSRIERGLGSFSAEQFLFLLEKFSISLNYFVETKSPGHDDAAVLQNALAVLGASHLKEVQGIFIPEKLTNVNEAIVEALSLYQSSRLVAALAPVMAKKLSRVNFTWIEKKLQDSGRENRLGWLLENVLKGVEGRLGKPFLPREVKLCYRRAATALEDVLSLKPGPSVAAEFGKFDAIEDFFDEGIVTKKTLERLRANRDPIADRWRILTRIRPIDFEEALKNSEKL